MVKALLDTMEYGTSNDFLLRGIVVAFCYKKKTDLQAVKLQQILEKEGLKPTLAHYTGLDPNSNEANWIEAVYFAMKGGDNKHL